jgi:dipeptidase E
MYLIKFEEKHYEKEIILADKSAGALCFGKFYFESEDTKDFKIHEFNDYIEVECIKLLDFIICPHYNLDGYSENLEAMVTAHSVIGIALDNNCAIEIIDNNYRIIATNDTANAYKVYQNGTKINSVIRCVSHNFQKSKKH